VPGSPGLQAISFNIGRKVSKPAQGNAIFPLRQRRKCPKYRLNAQPAKRLARKAAVLAPG
jgi:hypothetical protein